MPTRIKNCAHKTLPSSSPPLTNIANDAANAKSAIKIDATKSPKKHHKIARIKAAAPTKASTNPAHRTAAKTAFKAALEARTAARQAVFEALQPHGVSVTSSHLYTKYNWQVELTWDCTKCGFARAKGCLCL